LYHMNMFLVGISIALDVSRSYRPHVFIAY
jgi:hypothetical protein